MRCFTAVTAEQLKSVAQRYRRVTECSSTVERSRHGWRDRQPAHRDGLAVGSDTPIARRQRVEAILLLTREPFNSRKLAQHARLADGTEARTIVRQLNRLYDEAGRAFRVEEVAGGFQLLTRRQFAPWLRRLEHVPPQVRLSAPAMETLAVVAYRQPVLRAEIEAIRGVNCGEILRQLMERELVRIGGRSEELGRPYLYTTTKRFLQLFGLQNLDDLPRAVALRDVQGSTDPTSGLCDTPMSTDEVQQEQEKSEVSVTTPTQMPVDEMLEEVSSVTAVMPEGSYDDDFEEEDVDDFEDEEDEDEEEGEEDEEYGDDVEGDDVDEYEDDEEEDDEYDDEDDDDEEEEFEDDDFEDDEWEEVEDDDEEEEEDLEEGWDDDDDDDDEWEDDEFDEAEDDEEEWD